MTTIIEAVYEQGVLKLLDTSGLKEHQHYRVILEELRAPDPPTDPTLAAELARRTTILQDGRRIVRLMGLFDRGESGPSHEEIESTLDEHRREQVKKWDELYGPEQP
jgi:predicted DNA-binding antitoxin AbrB/MazE fold protein